jgi:hypothetical protein
VVLPVVSGDWLLYVWRGLRGAVWGIALAFTLFSAQHFQDRAFRVDSAMEQLAICGVTLVELITAYILARAADRILSIGYEWQMVKRADRQREQVAVAPTLP